MSSMYTCCVQWICLEPLISTTLTTTPDKTINENSSLSVPGIKVSLPSISKENGPFR